MGFFLSGLHNSARWEVLPGRGNSCNFPKIDELVSAAEILVFSASVFLEFILASHEIVVIVGLPLQTNQS